MLKRSDADLFVASNVEGVFARRYVWLTWVRAPVREKDRFWATRDGSWLAAATASEDPADDSEDVRAVAAAGAHLLENLGQVVKRDAAVVGADLSDGAARESEPVERRAFFERRRTKIRPFDKREN